MVSLPAGVTRRAFGKLSDGQSVRLYTLTNRHGMQAEITNFGGVLVALKVPDRHGKLADVLLGYDTLAGYLHDHQTYFGATIGRYANRIAFGRFSLDGKTYTLPINNPPNSLHGGAVGFNRRLWRARPESTPQGPALALRYTSPGGEEGYPGTVQVRVVYTLTNDDALRIDYTATADKDTVVNLTSHGYFNLSGEGSGKVLNTDLTIYAHHYTPINQDMIPTGAIAPVAGTPLDFTRPTPIGARIHDDFEQLKLAGGYDFNYVLDAGASKTPALAAEAYDPATGRVMKLHTTQPGLQFYSANFLKDVHGKHGHIYGPRSAFALEAEHFPDSPNHPNFPSTELKPGQQYHETTIYQFFTRPQEEP